MLNAQTPMNNTPMNNTMQMIAQFKQFKQNFQGNPKQKVMELLNSGQMTQAQFNQYQQMAQQFQSLVK
jgi:hypothetical protein